MANLFEKVSFEQFEKDLRANLKDDAKVNIRELYDAIKLPSPSTKKAAGYDFFAPIGFSLLPGECLVIPTGIKAKCQDNEFLLCAPRSGQGTKYFATIANTVGVIDADYYGNQDNEGHIFIKIRRPDKLNRFKTENMKDASSKKYDYLKPSTQLDSALNVDPGMAFCQGIFVSYDVTENDERNLAKDRIGGHGSTDKYNQSNNHNNNNNNQNNKYHNQNNQNNVQRSVYDDKSQQTTALNQSSNN